MPEVLVDSHAEAIINAPIESIDLTEWVYTMTDKEYQACSKAHIAAGASRTTDGKRMSLNVEHVGRLLVEHYVEALSERHHARLESETDAIGPSIDEAAKTHVTWEFWVERVSDNSSKFTNRVKVTAPPGFEDLIKQRGITMEQAKANEAKSAVPHNKEETPMFAKDIERKALEGRWNKH